MSFRIKNHTQDTKIINKDDIMQLFEKKYLMVIN